MSNKTRFLITTSAASVGAGRLETSREAYPETLVERRLMAPRACGYCRLRAFCEAWDDQPRGGVEPAQDARLYLATKQSLPLGEQGSPAVHVVGAGALKTIALLDDGSQRVIAFHLPGDVVDQKAYEACDCGVSMVAMQPTALCVFPMSRLEAHVREVPEAFRQLVTLFSVGLTRELSQSRIWQDHSAEQRLSAALLDIAVRLSGCGETPCDAFLLPMTRRDLADYLGMTQETISRQFKNLEERGCISARGRRIALRKRSQLNELAGHRDRRH